MKAPTSSLSILISWTIIDNFSFPLIVVDGFQISQHFRHDSTTLFTEHKAQRVSPPGSSSTFVSTTCLLSENSKSNFEEIIHSSDGRSQITLKKNHTSLKLDETESVPLEYPILQIQQQLSQTKKQLEELILSATLKLEQVQTSWDALVKSLAALSLKDYEWRSEIFKERRANRALEESLARMRGERASYVRPMYADEDKIGPLGKAEKNAVEWLYQVIEEEAKRAKKIAEGGGKVVRPIEMAKQRRQDNLLVPAEEEFGSFIAIPRKLGIAEYAEDIGPLAALELKAVEFLKIIKDSETERALLGKLRPMDLEEAKRGPLGAAEANLVSALESIKSAEIERMNQSRRRGGELVRPIDVPGPLGEIEKAVMTIVTAERKRAMEGRFLENGKVVRPMEASIQGPLGAAERGAMEALDRLSLEEQERFRSLQRYLEENRPMERNRDSPLGLIETFTVGLARGPKLLLSVIRRVKELLQSKPLSEEDIRIVEEKQTPRAQDPPSNGEEASTKIINPKDSL